MSSSTAPSDTASSNVTPPGTPEAMTELDAWTAAGRMSPGINIGNTLENTTQWETGWGNPRITKAFVEHLASLGFKTVRLPVAWDTYAVEGRVQPDKMQRVREVVEWITGAGMFCVLNIHWDGGWIDSSVKEKYPTTFATFTPEAEKKYRSYWAQIAEAFADENELLIFEALNEETNFSGAGAKAYATLARVQQIFIDVVRSSGGNNAQRLLIVAGYHTDIAKTVSPDYVLPRDNVAGRMFISVHYYTPWQFCGMTKDEDWGKVMPTWGTAEDVAQLENLFDQMAGFSKRHDLPVFLGEFGVVKEKEAASRARWLSAVARAAHSRKMVPVFWDTGNDLSRHPPYAATAALSQMLSQFGSER